jgi:hypothetical protein
MTMRCRDDRVILFIPPYLNIEIIALIIPSFDDAFHAISYLSGFYRGGHETIPPLAVMTI